MSAEMAHWRRPLKDGGVEFFFRAPDGQMMRGSADSGGDVDFLQAQFERWAGCSLPAPDVKPGRFVPARETAA